MAAVSEMQIGGVVEYYSVMRAELHRGQNQLMGQAAMIHDRIRNADNVNGAARLASELRVIGPCLRQQRSLNNKVQ